MTKKYYREIQADIEALGGSMRYDKSAGPWGAWVITLGNKQGVFASNGNRFYPTELDTLYTPNPNKKTHKTWDDFEPALIDGAIAKLVALLK